MLTAAAGGMLRADMEVLYDVAAGTLYIQHGSCPRYVGRKSSVRWLIFSMQMVGLFRFMQWRRSCVYLIQS